MLILGLALALRLALTLRLPLSLLLFLPLLLLVEVVDRRIEIDVHGRAAGRRAAGARTPAT